MKKRTFTLCALQAVAALATLIAACWKTESIIATGPALTMIGLLLGLSTRALQSPLVLGLALSGPLVCGLISFLIAAFRWNPREARLPTIAILAAYLALLVPVASFALPQISQWRTVVVERDRRPSPFQFRLRTLLIATTACCVLIPIARFAANRGGEGFFFFGYTVLVLLLSGLVAWRYGCVRAA